MAKTGHLAYSVLRFLPLLFSTGGTLLLAVSLQAQGFGEYSAALAMTQVISAVGLLGQDQLILQGRLSLGIALARGGLVVLLTGAASVTLGLLTLPEGQGELVFAVVATSSLIQLCSVPFAFLLRARASSTRANSELAVRLTYQVGLNAAGSALGTARSAAFGGTIGAVIGVFLVGGYFTHFWRKNNSERDVTVTSAPWRQGVLFGIDSILYSTGVAIPIIIIAATASNIVNAQVRVVFLCYTAIVGVSRAFNGELFRARLYAADDAEQRRSIWLQLRLVLLRYGAVVAVGVGAAGLLLPVVMGAEYEQARWAVLVLALGVLFQFFGFGLTTLAVTNGGIKRSIVRLSLTLALSVLVSSTLPLGPIELALLLVANDMITCLFFSLYKRTRHEG
ncbi:hypothetical protein [Frigoribacterium sp. VKM Ac-2836]|uniref:hypothetical protein n=1 Tax=Frigoribacterium sp. VKM Ac-2836 TaxID=2739014 RepID=UPI001565AFF5|nr:hypothetical protein [Frigoribacterium sp. VKM Ac-2836]NRD27272.1 hypothetical protein [Frigoribacterium sp. VKM Ac-2836]